MIGRAVAVTLLVSSLVACGGKSSTTASPTTPAAPTAPTPTLYTITGIVDNIATGAPIANATATVVDGPNAGLTSAPTDSSGSYRLSGLTFAGFSVSVTAAGFFGSSKGVPLTAGALTTTVSFSLAPQNYSGTWRGTTSQDLPISFTVTGATVSALTVDIIVTLAGSPPGSPTQPAVSCLSSFRASGPVTFSGNSFDVPITSTSLRSPSGVFYSTTARGTLASETSARGSVASFTASQIMSQGCFSKIVDCSWPGATCSQGEKSWNATRQ